MTLEELIEEGNTFEITYKSGYVEPVGYGLVKTVPDRSYLKNADIFSTWIQKCRRFLIQNYPNDLSIDSFNEIDIEKVTQAKIYEMVGVLTALKEIPNICETKKVAPSNVQNINVNQSQNINIDIVLQAIKDEIGRTGIQSLKDIEGETEKEKKQNILSKLKEFGESTLSNIVANILTNPTIWTQL